MRLSKLVGGLLLLLPAAAAAQDAGTGDAGTEDAAVPDASSGDETGERCLDGYDRSYVEACEGKAAGAVCTFRGGESGRCAALRCMSADGLPLAVCVATTGMPAPPPVLRDAGLASGDASAALDSVVGGGGCAVGAPFGTGLWPWLSIAGLVGVVRRRRAAR